MPTDQGAIAFYICANAAKYAACAYILADMVVLRGQKLIIWCTHPITMHYAEVLLAILDIEFRSIRASITNAARVSAKEAFKTKGSTIRILLTRDNFTTKDTEPAKVIFNYALGGRDARRSAYKLNDITDKANKPGDRIRGAEEVEGAVEVKKSEAATFQPGIPFPLRYLLVHLHIIKDIAKQTPTALGRTHPSKPQNEPKETAVDQTNGATSSTPPRNNSDKPEKRSSPPTTLAKSHNAPQNRITNKLRHKVHRAVDVLCGPNINKYLLTAVLDAHKAKTNNKRPKVDTKKDLLRTYLEERYNADPNFKMDISRAELYNKAFPVDLYAPFLGFNRATEADQATTPRPTIGSKSYNGQQVVPAPDLANRDTNGMDGRSS
ncbi:hypothetical protein Tdes44962_MAKER10334, partial [Teratosphaeria destructans]